MTDFPADLPIEQDGYLVDPITGREMSRADDGTPIIRDLWPGTRYSIQFTLFPLTNQQVRDIRDFYQTNKLTQITWADPWDGGQTYIATLLDEPRLVGVIGPWARVSVAMEGVRNA